MERLNNKSPSPLFTFVINMYKSKRKRDKIFFNIFLSLPTKCYTENIMIPIIKIHFGVSAWDASYIVIALWILFRHLNELETTIFFLLRQRRYAYYSKHVNRYFYLFIIVIIIVIRGRKILMNNSMCFRSSTNTFFFLKK